MLFTGTGKYSGGLWECSMIGVEDRRPIQRSKAPFPLSSASDVGEDSIF